MARKHFKAIVMKKLKNLSYRFFILCTYIVFAVAYNSCASDQKDKDLLSIQTFLEQHDGTTWTAIEKDMRIYIRLHDDKDKDVELWVSEMKLAKLMAHKECFYYSQEKLATDEEDLENFSTELVFTDLDDEPLIFSMDGERLKLEFETSNNVKEAVYFLKTKENLAELDICPDERSQSAFDWRVLRNSSAE